MKKIILLALTGILMAGAVSAQNYKNSRFYDGRTNRLNYGAGWADMTYFGFRIGPTFSSLSSDINWMDDLGSKTGLNIGVVLGIGLSEVTPVFFETGLNYTEKGAKGTVDLPGGGRNEVKFGLEYFEVPLVFKYRYALDDHFCVEPFLGGFVALGISGKEKNYTMHETHSSYNEVNHWDGGLRLGVGASYDMFYAELGYDIGLANIQDDDYDSTKTGALLLNFGVNF